MFVSAKASMASLKGRLSLRETPSIYILSKNHRYYGFSVSLHYFVGNDSRW